MYENPKSNSGTRNFWWSSSGKEKSISWAAWDTMCQPKGAGGCGFRDIQGFNLAMIAKQGWRFIQNPESLVARVMRSRYYAHTTFMNATPGTRPSYLWRSLLRGKEVLQLGLRYRMERGMNIRIWEDPWIPRPYTFKPCDTYRNIFPDCRVGDLIDPDLGAWRADLLSQIFLPFDSECIQSIPIGSASLPDPLIWHHTTHGRYTVHSGYHTYMTAKRRTNDAGQVANEAGNKKFWGKVWSVPTLPKVRVFLWRVLKRILPTGRNLNRRIPTISNLCPNCQNHVEDEFHCLIECPAVHEVWERTFPNILNWSTRNIENMIFGAIDVMDLPSQCYFSLLCWFLWKRRCLHLYEGKSLSTTHIITQAGGLANEVLSSLEKSTAQHHLSDRYNSEWNPPSPPFLSINVDAGFGESGARACGIIVRDCLGSIVHASSLLLPPCVDILHEELLAILRGLEMGRDHNYPNIELWSDCLGAVNLLDQVEEPLHSLAALIAECKQCSNAFDSCSILFTRREYNNPAHLLARWSLSHFMSFSWGPNPPPHVIDAALADLY